MYIKVQIILLLFGLELYSGHSIAKFQIENGTEIYEIRELPNKTIEFVNPKRKVPTLREIIFYKVIEKPYFSENNVEENPIKESGVEEKSNIEEYDFDETLRPFTNSHGYQFIDWGAQETHKDGDQNTFIAPIKKNNDMVPHDDTMNGDDNENDKFSDDVKDADDALDYYEDKDDVINKNTNSNKKESEYYDYLDEDVPKKDEDKNIHKNKHDDDFLDEETEDIPIKKKDDDLNKNVKSNKNNSDELFDEEAHDVKDKAKDDVSTKNVDNLKNNTEELNNSTKEIVKHDSNEFVKEKPENVTQANVVDSTKKVNDKINETVTTGNDHQGSNDTSSNDEVGRKSDVKHGIDDIAKRLRSQLFDSTKRKYHTINRHENAGTEKNRRKRETFYRNIPEAPVLPDLDLDGLPDYLQEMLENRPSTHRKHNQHSFSQSNLNNESNSPYDLPEPDIEIRNNFNTEEESIEGQDVESSAIFKRNPEEHSEANSDDTNQDFDMTDKLKDMFDSIQNPFIKDEKKPRTYGMKLKAGAGEIWNDILGSPLITDYNPENNPELLEKELKYKNKIHEINKNIDDAQEGMTSINSDNINSKESRTEIPSSMESDEIIDDKEIMTENLSESYINLMPESELPDFKIEHMEQIPRIYRKDEPSTDIPSAEHDNSSTTLTELEQVLKIIKPESMEQNNPETINSTSNTPERAVREISKEQLPIDDINLKRKMQDSFDNILKRFPHSKSIANNLNPAEDYKTNRDRNKIPSYGMHLEGDRGYVWNELSKPGIHTNVGYTETAHANAVKDSSEESTSAPDEFKPVESTEDEIKESTNINDIVDKEKELLKKKNTTLVKPDFDDLLKKYDFWQWLTNWTSTQVEILNKRTEKLVKDEVNRQLVQEKLNKTNDQSSLNKETPKHNSTVENNKPEINSTDIVSETNKDKTNSTLGEGKENTSKSKKNISKQENNNNNNINAEAIYGNAIAADHVTNIFIFYPNISVHDENMKKLGPVLDKSKLEILISKEVPKNVTFDERLGLNSEEQDDNKNNEPSNDEVTAEASTETPIIAEADLEKTTEINENNDRTNESSNENQTSESIKPGNNLNPDDRLSTNIDESTEHIIDTTTDSNTPTLTSEINDPLTENTELDKSDATTQESSDEDAAKLLQ